MSLQPHWCLSPTQDAGSLVGTLAHPEPSSPMGHAVSLPQHCGTRGSRAVVVVHHYQLGHREQH